MKNGSTILFVIFLFLTLVFLTLINFLKGYLFLAPLGDAGVIAISGILIVFIIAIFIYREIENNQVLNQFITIVTHKFRTPLTGIRWTIDMLQKDLTLLEKKDLLMEMQKANERLMEIVDLLVSFAKFDRKLDYAFVAVSLREIVNISLTKYSVVAKSKNITFSIDSGKELPMVIIDKAKIQFVVDMLIDNAIKYTPKDGSVNFSFDMDKNSITLEVKDSGMGFGFFDGKRIFRHFYRSETAKIMDTNGLGLGLYTARKIVSQHKGRLWAESPGYNLGSTFYLRLPIKR